MKRKGFLLGLALVIVVNVIVLAGVNYNRSGTPTTHITLTERELPIDWSYGTEENTGLSLRINWNQYNNTYKNILTQQKLESLGFSVPETRKIKDPDSVKQPLARKAYAVLEYDGDAWSQLLSKRQEELSKALENAKTDEQRKNLQDNYDRFERTSSRLMLVDVGQNPTALRTQYPDTGKYLITRVRVTAHAYFRGNKNNPFQYDIQGFVSEILPSTLYVPREYFSLIQRRNHRRTNYYNRYNPNANDANQPHYQVTLDYGKRYEPWVESVMPGIPAP
jgi:hypothetical protein